MSGGTPWTITSSGSLVDPVPFRLSRSDCRMALPLFSSTFPSSTIARGLYGAPEVGISGQRLAVRSPGSRGARIRAAEASQAVRVSPPRLASGAGARVPEDAFLERPARRRRALSSSRSTTSRSRGSSARPPLPALGLGPELLHVRRSSTGGRSASSRGHQLQREMTTVSPTLRAGDPDSRAWVWHAMAPCTARGRSGRDPERHRHRPLESCRGSDSYGAVLTIGSVREARRQARAARTLAFRRTRQRWRVR